MSEVTDRSECVPVTLIKRLSDIMHKDLLKRTVCLHHHSAEMMSHY